MQYLLSSSQFYYIMYVKNMIDIGDVTLDFELLESNSICIFKYLFIECSIFLHDAHQFVAFDKFLQRCDGQGLQPSKQCVKNIVGDVYK